VVHGARARNSQLWGSGNQRLRSYEAQDRLGGLVEASFLTSFGHIAFLVKCDDYFGGLA